MSRLLGAWIGLTRMMVAVCLIGVTVLINIRIISRFVLNLPQNWIPGYVTLLAVWAVALGVAVYYAEGEFIRIDFFVNRISRSAVKKAVAWAGSSVMVVFAATALLYSVDALLMSNYKSSLAVGNINYRWYTFPLVWAMALALVATLRGMLKPKENEE
jgi:TRAP-type C4-dicarboxylate transport system permease small subunit